MKEHGHHFWHCIAFVFRLLRVLLYFTLSKQLRSNLRWKDSVRNESNDTLFVARKQLHLW